MPAGTRRKVHARETALAPASKKPNKANFVSADQNHRAPYFWLALHKQLLLLPVACTQCFVPDMAYNGGQLKKSRILQTGTVKVSEPGYCANPAAAETQQVTSTQKKI